MKVKINFIISSVCFFWLSLTNLALATPRTLPFSYPYETLPKGELELEVYTDVNPLRVAADPSDSTAGNLLEGRVVGFERVLAGKNSKAVVALELTLTSSGKTRLSKTYQAEQGATDDSLGAFAVAMEQALAKIYAEFLADLASR